MLENIYVRSLLISVICVLLYHLLRKKPNIEHHKNKTNYNNHIIVFIIVFIISFLINIYCKKELNCLSEYTNPSNESSSNSKISSNCPF